MEKGEGNSMSGGVWQAAAHGITELGMTELTHTHTHTHTHIHTGREVHLVKENRKTISSHSEQAVRKQTTKKKNRGLEMSDDPPA